MSELLECKRCDLRFEASKVANGKCPHCRRLLNFVNSTGTESYFLSSRAVETEPQKEMSLKDVVLAQNRTTHAIRSLAVFFFTTLCTSLIGYALLAASASAALTCSYGSECSADEFLILAWIVIIAGFIFGLVTGVRELNKSRL